MNTKTYDLCLENLVFDTLGLLGLIHTQLPKGVRPGSKFARMRGSQWNNEALMNVAKKIEDITYRFDQVQHVLGLPSVDAARFGHLPAGSTNTLNEETTPMAKKPPAAKSKAATSKAAPKPAKAASKRPPIHGGGTSYNDNTHM